MVGDRGMGNGLELGWDYCRIFANIEASRS